LGFYPGLVNPAMLPRPKKEINTTYGYLKRYDGAWLDPYKYLPYPMKPYQSLDEFEIEEDTYKNVIITANHSRW
jgi:hypothetical protein